MGTIVDVRYRQQWWHLTRTFSCVVHMLVPSKTLQCCKRAAALSAISCPWAMAANVDKYRFCPELLPVPNHISTGTKRFQHQLQLATRASLVPMTLVLQRRYFIACHRRS